MTQEGFKRKLTAVLSADAVGYSRLMAEDEAATVKTIAGYREIMSSLIKQHRGRVVDSPGDNILAEFSSVVDAVQCAVAVQNEIQTRNAGLAENRRMEFRIGINLGDVIDEDDRLYGDGVNIAARLEALADPGGVCVSKTAFDQIETKLPLGYEYLGEQPVKNIPKPVGAYRVLMQPDDAGRVIGEKKFLGRFSRSTAMATIVILVVVAAVLVGWNIYLQQSKKVEPASVEKMAFPLPDKPSIAVLPITNISGDPEQEYFSDGITEEIITALSKTPKMFVIARHSTSTYKGKPVKVKQVAEELGVRYVLEGSVRKEGDRVRITAQLIDALTGHNLWAERYDRDLKDIFALQDEISLEIINALQVELTEGEHARLWRKGTDNLEAYIKSLRARELYLTQTKENNAQAKRIAKEAIALDPEYAPPYHVLSVTNFYDILFGTTKSPKQSMTKAIDLIQKAIGLDDSYALAHGWLGFLYTLLGKYEEGINEAQKGVSLDPNGAHNYLYLEVTLRFAGRHEESVHAVEKAIRLNPSPPVTYYQHACMTYVFTKQYDKAIAAGKQALKVSSPNDISTRASLATAYILAGREEEARSIAEEILRINPKYSVQRRLRAAPYKNKADSDLIAEALGKAGLSE